MDCSPPGSSVHGISQARIREWVAISPFRGSSKPRDEPRPPALVGGYLPLAFQVALVVKNPPANALDVKEVEAEVKVAQSYLTLCDPVDCSPPSSSVHGISQARILEYFYFYFLLQCILLTQKSNPHLLHWQADSLPLSHVRSPDDMKMNPKPLLNICIL